MQKKNHKEGNDPKSSSSNLRKQRLPIQWKCPPTTSSLSPLLNNSKRSKNYLSFHDQHSNWCRSWPKFCRWEFQKMPLRKQREGIWAKPWADLLSFCVICIMLSSFGKKILVGRMSESKSATSSVGSSPRTMTGPAPWEHVFRDHCVCRAHGNEELVVIHSFCVYVTAGHLINIPPEGGSVTLQLNDTVASQKL